MTAASQAAAGFEFSPAAGSPAQSPKAETPARAAATTFDVFISYSHVDKATADATCATLEQAGIRCWIAPRDIMPGDEWGAAIVKAIDQCRAMVLIFSSSANSSKQIRREVERAVNAGVTDHSGPHRERRADGSDGLFHEHGALARCDDGAAGKSPAKAGRNRSRRCCKPHAARQRPASTSAMSARPLPRPPAPRRSAPRSRCSQEIMNFSYQRTTKQAFGWYLMYLAHRHRHRIRGRPDRQHVRARSKAPPGSAWPPGSYRRSPITSRSLSCCFGIARRTRRASCSCSQASCSRSCWAAWAD